jgi:hypothetical protein
MRGAVRFVAGAVATAVIFGGVALGSSRSPAIKEAQTLVRIFEFRHFTGLEDPPRGEGSGDGFLFRGRLTTTDGSPTGFAVIQCVSTFPSRLLDCNGVARLGRGQIVAQGLVRERQRVHAWLAVLGGTGEFRNVRGTLEVQDLGPNRARFTFRLLP